MYIVFIVRNFLFICITYIIISYYITVLLFIVIIFFSILEFIIFTENNTNIYFVTVLKLSFIYKSIIYFFYEQRLSAVI